MPLWRQWSSSFRVNTEGVSESARAGTSLSPVEPGAFGGLSKAGRRCHGPAGWRRVSRRAGRKVNEKRENEPKGEAANARAEHRVQGNVKHGRDTAISIEPVGDQAAVPDVQDSALGADMASPEDEVSSRVGAQSVDSHSEDADEEDSSIVMDLNAQTDDIDTPPQEQAESADSETGPAASPAHASTRQSPITYVS